MKIKSKQNHMFQFNSLFIVIIIIASVSSTAVNATLSGSERFYTKSGSCGLNGPSGNTTMAYPCFSCMNVPLNMEEDNNSPPSGQSDPVKSVYIHCFLDKNSVYTILFAERDCKGAVLGDLSNDNTCPDCTGCSSTSDCGKSPNCDAKCCGTYPECYQCQNALMCSMYKDDCKECPGCANPNPYCNTICTDSEICASQGIACEGCSGCLIPPSPCKYCSSVEFCEDPYKDQYCNKGNCPVCTGAPNSDDNGQKSAERVLTDIKLFREHMPSKIEVIPSTPFFRDGRVLEGSPSSNFTTNTMRLFPVYDAEFNIAVVSLYSNKSISQRGTFTSFPIIQHKCQEATDGTYGETRAVKISCSFGQPSISSATGYRSVDDCNRGTNITFSSAVIEETLIYPKNDKWYFSVKCNGWGKAPSTPTLPAPKLNEITYGVRIRYPDRRCLAETGNLVDGGILPCYTCVAFPNQEYKRFNCTGGHVMTYREPDCTGVPVSIKQAEKCEGLGPLRGIYNFERRNLPIGSVAFLSIHSDTNRCSAENVAIFAGVESNVCTELKPPTGVKNMVSSYVHVNCETRKIYAFENKGCIGQPLFNVSFTNDICIDIPDSTFVVRASCTSYVTPRSSTVTTLAPTTPAPTTRSPTPTPTTRAPTSTPTTSTPTASQGKCVDVQRGCSQYGAATCAGKTASWTIDNVTNVCRCMSTVNASKVAFKLQIPNTNVDEFKNKTCNAIDIFVGTNKKVIETLKSASFNDYPVEMLSAPIQVGNNTEVEFVILGFIETATADTVISFINIHASELIAKIKQISALINGSNGIDVNYVTGSAKRIDNVALCTCERADDIKSGVLTNTQSVYFAQSVVAGLFALLAN